LVNFVDQIERFFASAPSTAGAKWHTAMLGPPGPDRPLDQRPENREYSRQFGRHPGNPGQDEEPGMRMGDTLRSILTRLVAYIAVVIAAGLLFLAGVSVYKLMWPRPVVPFSQMGHSP